MSSTDDIFVCEDRRFCVQCVKYRLHHDQIDAAVEQSFKRVNVDAYELRELNVSVGGVVDIGRNARGAVGRPKHSCDETRFLIGRPRVRGSPSDTCRFEI